MYLTYFEDGIDLYSFCPAGVGDRTALHYAASRGLDVKILIDANADQFAIDSEGNTPLHYASKEGCLNVIEELLKARFSSFTNLHTHQLGRCCTI